jgi:excinuclease UvrABC nuclease subunit
MLLSELDNIHGIGESTKDKILNFTKDIGKLKDMPHEELVSVFGKRAGTIIYNHYRKGL